MESNAPSINPPSANTGPSQTAPRPLEAAKVPITVIVPTLNEASNLPRCLDYLRWADDVVVVDSNSTDGTQRIAESYGARVINFAWNGKWPKKRNWVLRNADLRYPWILIVDADECIVPELAAEIGEAIRSDKYVGYYINRRFMFLNTWIKHCGYYPSWNLRLLKRGHGEYEQLTDVEETGSGDNEIHEHIAVDGPVNYLQHDMLHYAFPNIHTFVEKHNRYSNWEAAVQSRLVQKHANVAGNATLTKRRRLKNLSRHMPFRPTLRFLYSYVLKAGFLDGREGFIFCRLLSMYEFLSVAKYYELRHPASRNSNAKGATRQLP